MSSRQHYPSHEDNFVDWACEEAKSSYSHANYWIRMKNVKDEKLKFLTFEFSFWPW